MEIAQKTPQAAQWANLHYNEDLLQNESRIVLVACEEEQVMGFLVARDAAQEWELENIVVDVSIQRRKIATTLLEELIRQVKIKHGACIHLEVRTQNNPAISLYRKLGFQMTGQRINYYSNPQEDALLLRRDL